MRTAANKMEFTAKAIDALKPTAKRTHIYAQGVEGLGVRVEGQKKTFFWWRSVRGQMKFRKIGTYPSTSVAQAIGTAQEWNGTLQTSIRTGAKGDPFTKVESLTLKELVEKYREGRVMKRAAHPALAVRDLAYLCKPFEHWYSRKAALISRAEVRELHAKLSKDAPTWADRVVQCLRRIIRWGQKQEIFVGENPAQGIELNGDGDGRERFLQPAELVRLDAALAKEKNKVIKDFTEIALSTGLRKSNILGMRWEWVNQERWEITVPRESSKNKKAVVLPLSQKAIDALLRRGPKESGWVFPSTKSSSGHVTEIKRKWQTLLERAAIQDFHAHDCRRTFASYSALAGQPLQAIGKSLGHSRTLGSVETYARLNVEGIRQTMLAGESFMEAAKAAAKKKLESKKPKLLAS